MSLALKRGQTAAIVITLCLAAAAGYFFGASDKTARHSEQRQAAALQPFSTDALKIVLTEPGEEEPPVELEAFNERLRKIANEGNALAQMALGLSYADGSNGNPQNHEEAAKWYHAAAEQGRVDAQLFLAKAYAEGQGVPQSAEEAFKWRLSAAEQGDDAAQLLVGYAYALGKGVPENKITAEEWFKRSADQGNLEAQTSYAMAKSLRELPLRMMEKSLEESHQPSAGENTYIIKREE